MDQYRCKCNKGYRRNTMNRNQCACEKERHECTNTNNDPLEGMPIGMAYVPWQQWNDVFTGECGLAEGTIFPDLVKPYWIKCGERR